MALRPALLLALLLCCAPAARAEEPVEREAERVRAALAAETPAALDEVLAGLAVDPWILAEHLCVGAPEAAAAVAARLADDPRHAALHAYVDWRVAHPRTPAAVAAWARLRAAARSREREALQALLASTPDVGGGVSEARRLRLQAVLARTPAERAAAHRAMAEAAAAIGWHEAELAARALAADASVAARDPEAALAEARRGLARANPRTAAASRRRLHAAAARAQRQLGRHEASLQHAERAYALSEGPREERDALRLLLIIEIATQRRHAVRRHLPRLIALDETLGDEHGRMASQAQLASLEASLGDLGRALTRIHEVLRWMEAHGSAWERRGAHLQAAKIWIHIMDGPRCLEHVRRAREAGQGLGLDDSTLSVFEGRAQLLAEDPAAAEVAFRRALAGMARAPLPARVDVLGDLAAALGSLGRPRDALAILDRARTEAAALAGPLGASARLGIETAACLARLQAGELDEALAAGQRAHAEAVPGLDDGLRAVVDARMARAWLARGRPREALHHARRAATLVVARSRALPDRVGAQHRRELRSVFDVGVAAAALAGDAEAFFTLVEEAGAVALRGRIGAGVLVEQVLEPALRQAGLALEEAETAAVRAYRHALATRRPEAVEAARGRLEEARRALERHREQVRARQAVAGQVLSPVVDTLEATRTRQAADEATVLLASGVTHHWALVVTGAATRLVRLAPKVALARLRATSVFEDPAVTTEATVAALHDALVAPLALAATTTRVHVVPGGDLAWVPFAALLPERTLDHLPSVTVARLLAARPAATDNRVLAVAADGGGGALPAALAEARAVGTQVLAGKDATEARVAAATAADGPRWRALHVACHGLVDPHHPLRSALALTPADGDDGLWTVSEILRHPVAADLVTLSACSSGRGAAYAQEGVLGFGHAFFVAGATRVLVSLWDVDDAATARFMQHLYAALRAGARPADALRDARGALRAEARWAHPAYWAGWQLWGAP